MQIKCANPPREEQRDLRQADAERSKWEEEIDELDASQSVVWVDARGN